MKKLLLLILFTASLSAVGFADVALVYENEAAAAQGKFYLATAVGNEVMVPAQLAAKSGNNLLAGLAGQPLFHVTLVRLDNDLDLAVVRLGDAVTSSDVQNMHRQKSNSILGFLPHAPAPSAVAPAWVGSVPAASLMTSTGPIILKINGEELGSKTIEMKVGTLRKSTFKLAVVVVSTEPVWSFSLELKSDPSVSFWKKGRKTDLNDVPRPVYTYDHQALFTALKDGKTVELPIEAHYVDKDKPYLWIITVKTKQGTVTHATNVIFH